MAIPVPQQKPVNLDKKLNKAMINGLFTIAIGTLIWFLPVPQGLEAPAWHLFAIMVATIIGFILQPLPMGALAFISITLTALTGVLKPADVLAGFSNTTVWLIVSAFVFAVGLAKTGLGKRIAYLLIHALGDNTLKLGYAIELADLAISPATPSNTARGGGIIFPIVRNLCSAFDSEPGPSSRKIGSYLMQVAYQADTVTAAIFLTAMAANPLMVTLASQTLGITLTWGQWAMAALVPGILTLILIPLILYKIYPPEVKKTPQAKEMAKEELKKMGPISLKEILVGVIFIGAILLWATSQMTKIDSAIIAMIAVSAMLLTKVIEWEDVLKEKGAWDTMIWIGALVALSTNLTKLGVIPWFSKAVSGSIVGVPWGWAFVILLIAYLYVHYGFASQTAHIAALYPAFIAVAVAAGAPPYLTALSFAFMSNLNGSMTHYAGGPSPIFFGAGYVDQKTWWKLGFIMSLIYLIIWVGIGSAWWKVLGLW
jgi:divalent anion:Na+ symporter, DASS family